MQISVKKTLLLLFVCSQSREIKSREPARRWNSHFFLQILPIKSKPFLFSYFFSCLHILNKFDQILISNSLNWITIFLSHQIWNVLQIVPWYPTASCAWVLVFNGGSKVAALVIKAVKLVKLTFYFLNDLNIIPRPAMYVAWQMIIQQEARKFGFVWT